MENGGNDGNGSVKPMKVTPFTLIVTVCQMYHVFMPPEGTSGGILKSLRPSVRYKSCLSDIS